MSLLRTALIVVASTASTHALAFQEQRQGGAVAPPAPVVAPAGATAAKALDLSTPGTAAAAKAGGTEVRIPGLGKLGSLPKLDFGLELLYGVSEPKAQLDQPIARDEPKDDDLTIRGTVRHKF